MRSIVIQSLACLTMLASCRPARQFVFSNPKGEALEDEMIIVKRKAVEKITGSIAANQYFTIRPSIVPLVIQFDDLNGDGVWDEAAILYSLKPNEKLTFRPELDSRPKVVKAITYYRLKTDYDTTVIKEPYVRAHVRHVKKNADNTFGPVSLQKDTMPVNALPTDFSKQPLPPYLTEGPAWENDKVGFRLYFDVRNGKDIWGKTTTRMVLDEVGTDTSKNYHHQADWGMDILKVGASLGAGSLALQVPLPNGKDTLVRLGGKNIQQVTYEKVADGPVRAIFRLKYSNWKIADGLKPVTVTEEIHIRANKYFYESHVTVTGAPKGAQLVTGIVNLHSKEVHEIKEGGYKGIYTYDVQSENKDKLGMAIVMPEVQVAGVAATPNANTDIQNTYIIKANIKDKKPIVFRFYAGWEKSDERFTSEEKFKAFLLKDLQ